MHMRSLKALPRALLLAAGRLGASGAAGAATTILILQRAAKFAELIYIEVIGELAIATQSLHSLSQPSLYLAPPRHYPTLPLHA